MISRLYIKNYAIIEEVSIDFSDGLTIITGETGAGKSIMLGALELILGRRADHKSLKDISSKCIVEASFDIGKYGLTDFFDAEDLDYTDQTIVRRELLPSGKSRAFINDTPTNLSALKRLGESLIDLHRQFATQDINNVSFQLRMLDALANNKSELLDYQKEYKTYVKAKQELADLQSRAASADQALDFIKFQLNEFEEANIQAGELIQLEKEQKIIENAEAIKLAFDTTQDILSERDGSIIELFRTAIQGFSQIKGANDEIDALYEKLNSLLLESEDISTELGKTEYEGQVDENRLVEITNRLDIIYRLLNKHQKQSEDDLLQFHNDLRQQINGFDNLTEEIARLENKIARSEKVLIKKSDVIRKRRRSVIGQLVDDVEASLAKMNMSNARLKIDMQPIDHFTITGRDHIELLFSTNPGSPFLQVKQIASGGELSRLTLAVKSKVADAIPLPTLVYDEIDTGISGGTAMQMGELLDDLSESHQVIVITHTPQVAVKADKHLYVSKVSNDNQTITQIKDLNDEDRIVAIAKMLGGDPPSTAAIENAKELLAQS